MSRIKRPKCKHCKELFFPDYRNATRQQYCNKADCKKASKAVSQRRWLNKSENADYFRGPENVQRVQQWCRQNPGYWKNKPRVQNALQDPCCENSSEKQGVNAVLTESALQDLCIGQPAVFIGLIAQFTGSALQDDIASTIGRMQQLGNDILCQPNYAKGGQHAAKTSPLFPSDPPGAQTVRLGGSSPGP